MRPLEQSYNQIETVRSSLETQPLMEIQKSNFPVSKLTGLNEVEWSKLESRGSMELICEGLEWRVVKRRVGGVEAE